MNSNDEALDSDEREWRVHVRSYEACVHPLDEEDAEDHIDANEIASDGEPEENVASGQEGSNEEEQEEENNDDEEDRRSASPTNNNDDEEEARGKVNGAYVYPGIARFSLSTCAKEITLRERPRLPFMQSRQIWVGKGDLSQLLISALVANHFEYNIADPWRDKNSCRQPEDIDTRVLGNKDSSSCLEVKTPFRRVVVI